MLLQRARVTWRSCSPDDWHAWCLPADGLGALELAGVWIDHGVVAGAEVAGVLAGPRRHAAALVAADVAHLVAHLVVPVVAAANGAAGRAVCVQCNAKQKQKQA